MIVSQYTTSSCYQKSEGNGLLSREILEHAVGNDDNNVVLKEQRKIEIQRLGGR